MYQVQDGSRSYQFDGTKLGHATSARTGATRWVEFTLYRTKAGSYILSRVGHTIVYHDPRCPTATKTGLAAIPSVTLSDDYVPCMDCRPSLSALDEVCPEAVRHRATISDGPEGILEVLYRFDEAGVRYLTSVAARLLEQAAAADPEIAEAYRTQTIA